MKYDSIFWLSTKPLECFNGTIEIYTAIELWLDGHVVRKMPEFLSDLTDVITSLNEMNQQKATLVTLNSLKVFSKRLVKKIEILVQQSAGHILLMPNISEHFEFHVE